MPTPTGCPAAGTCPTAPAEADELVDGLARLLEETSAIVALVEEHRPGLLGAEPRGRLAAAARGLLERIDIA